MDINALLDWLFGAKVGLAIVGVCAVLAQALPAPGDDAPVWWRLVYRVVNIVGANNFRAANADDVAASKKDP